jgi:hypothetical protein
MVKFQISIIRQIIFIASLLAGGCIEARTVKSVDIQSVGLALNSVTNNSEINACKKFRPTKAQIVRFFNKAYPVETYVLTTDRYSSCYARGSLKYSDGSFGEWFLYSSGTATFTFNRGDSVNYFYKYNKWHDPFACTYGLSSEGEC